MKIKATYYPSLKHSVFSVDEITDEDIEKLRKDSDACAFFVAAMIGKLEDAKQATVLVEVKEFTL